MKDNKNIRISTHVYDYADKWTNRIKWTLYNRHNRFVDAFDVNPDNCKIRFYGSCKEYDLNNIPKSKMKLWDNYFDVFRPVEE